MRLFLILSIPVVLCLVIGCGDDNPVIHESPDPQSIQFAAAICEHLDVDSVCETLELFPSRWARLRTVRTTTQGPLIIRDSTTVQLEESEMYTIQTLLDSWDDYEAVYHPPHHGRWPSTSCKFIRYCKSDTAQIIVVTLGQETLPPTPDSLRSAILYIRNLIREKLGEH